MILITILFIGILFFERYFLKQKNAKPRTYRIVIGTVILACLSIETLHFFKNQWILADFIKTIFDPVEKLILFRK